MAGENTKSFLTYWTEGMKLAGMEYFQLPEEGFAAVDNKWQCIPLWNHIEQSYSTMSHGEKTFLGAMVSFYNPELGEKLLRHSGDLTPCAVITTLDSGRRRVLAGLMQTYGGW